MSGTTSSSLIQTHDHVKQFKKDKSFTFSVKSGKLTTWGSIPTSVFIPGDTIPVTVSVSNQSSKKAKGFEVKLREKVYITAESHSEKFSATIAKQVHTFPSELKSSKSVEDVLVNLSLPQNMNEICNGKIFQRVYEVRVFLFLFE